MSLRRRHRERVKSVRLREAKKNSCYHCTRTTWDVLFCVLSTRWTHYDKFLFLFLDFAIIINETYFDWGPDYTRRGFARFSKYRTLTRCFIGNAKVDNSEIKVISPMRASISRPAQVVMHFLHHAFCGPFYDGTCVRAWLKELRQVFFAVTVNKTQVWKKWLITYN